MQLTTHVASSRDGAPEKAWTRPDRLDAFGGSARERRLPVEDALGALLPEGGIQRGTAVTVTGCGAVALTVEASLRGSRVAVGGTDDLGVAALAERGRQPGSSGVGGPARRSQRSMRTERDSGRRWAGRGGGLLRLGADRTWDPDGWQDGAAAAGPDARAWNLVFAAAAVVDRVRWLLEGWYRSPERPTGPITLIRLTPCEVLSADGHHLGMWGERSGADDLAARALARVHGLLAE